ncbi:ZW10 interactor isoform X2 [Psammomys obesus]|uniref:ZW10 interactor isoform X2 n=1 Tax=Psammomys obesus TaxID=48139 RepID=UPI0024533001|nr:ZW10 interactor isoform X2 [Psammomys obesus]
MASEETTPAAAEGVLVEVAGVLEPVGLQEEAELPARILEEFVRNSRKKDKLLCSQLQVVNLLQNFLAQEDTAQSPDTLVSEDTSRQKATEAKEQWKELKAVYQDHMEAIKCGLSQALPKLEEIQRKYKELKAALGKLQAKKRVRSLAEMSAEIKERQSRAKLKLEESRQELETLKQQAGQEQDKLQRNQTYLQLLNALQNNLQISEAKAKDKDTTELALPSESL